jgi:hypothetical protein
MKPHSNEELSCVDVDGDMVKEFNSSKFGKLLGERLTPRPTAKMIMVSNPTSARNAYFDMKETI